MHEPGAKASETTSRAKGIEPSLLLLTLLAGGVAAAILYIVLTSITF